MRKIFVLTMLSIALIGFEQSKANAQENVYVDLSVLDSLGTQGASSAISSKPLFPQVKKVQKKSVKKVIAKKKVAKKKIVTKKATKKIVVNKKIAVQKPVVKKEAAKKDVKIKFANKPLAEKAIAYPEAKVANEVVAKPAQANIPVPSKVVEEIVEVYDVSSDVATLVDDNVKPVADKSVDAVKKTLDTAVIDNNILPVAKQSGVINSSIDDKPEATIPAKDIKPEVLVAEEVVVKKADVSVEPISNRIVFEAGVDSLSDENKKKVDSIVASFSNPEGNKISIIAYNLNTGEYAFKRKKESLDRVVSVRNYLFQQKYKNFSIKVINIIDEKDKENVVELEELK